MTKFPFLSTRLVICSIRKQFGPIAVGGGALVVDNSSAFRMDENVPLVIQEVNPDAMEQIRLGCGKGALIANPNCSTIICFMAATLLRRSAKDEAREILKNAPGVVVDDKRPSNHFPTPSEVSNKDDVAVGRIRRDVTQDGHYRLDIFVCGDQIRKGAALNAIQIAEMFL